jgi:BirA family biotin operon repressor/biotin-[acetyl-CoA-carboxylase] ligase
MKGGDVFGPEELRRGLATSVLGRVVHFLPEVDSTNSMARSLAERGEGDGAVVVTDFQTAGRGRLDRSWSAPTGSSLLFSLLLRPPIGVERVSQVTMAAGLGCIAGIARECGIPARLKWPNDITLGGCKAGGMLSEFALEADVLQYVIVGIGLNVNFDPRDVGGIPPEATSLMVHLARSQPRAPLLRAILEEMERRYRTVCEGESLREEWARALETIGRTVRVTTHTSAVEGLAEDVDDAGALILRLADGSRMAVHAGDVITVRTGQTSG